MNNNMKEIPLNRTLDDSIFLLLEGYPYMQKRCHKYDTDIFQTRLFGKKTICISGKDAAKVFYDNKFFVRKGVAPKRIQNTLLGKNGVQALDGKAHQNRKDMFISIMTPENIQKLVQYTKEQYLYNSIRWHNRNIILFDEVQKLLCQVACKWAGVPLNYDEIEQRATDLGKMIDGFGAIGPRYLEGKCARKRSEEWIGNIIDKIRSQKLTPEKGSAADIIAWYYDQRGKLLDTQIAAVELLNIVRPIVAIATYITFGAVAMYKYPRSRKKLQKNNEDYQWMFSEEVRRLYPFTPFVGAKVRKNFIWKQYYFKKGTLVMLDIYGINHDVRLWENPYEFIPERFSKPIDDIYLFMPQGGGDYKKGHRCAGELVTVEIMKASFDFIANNLEYQVPKQNLKIRLSRIPTLPKSGFRMEKVNRFVD
ncbi:cytochrome P450 [Anaeromicropila herbilytica]|uniref:Cytochrome P450 n=1 Tax=Anaeromicropila herbilytica TaxID=2785025 RepID=A0A7R7EKA0_9FIRM|nr:cytochrome P450 [Anaeromicropila herbilytica]BCN30431.1 cytochrome P450 [Anaeromicropila herbilytica]